MSGPAKTATKVLVIDDDPVVCELVTRVLNGWGHAVVSALDGEQGLRVLYAERPDLIVLDVELPDMDGWEVLDRIRDLGDMPVLMLTAKDRELDKVRGLRGGADDYLTKPFGHQELPARIDALMRRAATGRSEGASRLKQIYADARLTVDHGQRLVTSGGGEVPLTPLEFRLLAAFVENRGQVLSSDQLIEIAWRDPLVQPNQVKLYVSRLRRKLGDPEAIETVRGFGYRYLPPSEGPAV
jgi:DNA-binding response OmpR family regulator